MGFAEDFDAFWMQYPRKVGKLAARAAYEKARKSGVTQDQLLAGVATYLMHKPAYADWAHPKTWLSQGRWDDDYSGPRADRPVIQRAAAPVYVANWARECDRLHGSECCNLKAHSERMQRQRGIA